MIKNKSRKLALDTETLMPLQADDISKVNGGGISLPPTLTTTTLTTSTLTTTSRVSWNGGGQ